MRHKPTRKHRNTEKQRRRSTGGRKPSRRRRIQRRATVPRTLKQFLAMSKGAQDEWAKATSVVTEARATGKSPRKISKEFGIEFRTVLRKVGRALRKRANGRYVARPTDKLLRVLVIPTKSGLREIATRDSQQASLIARYWLALKQYLKFGEPSALHEFDDKKITDATGKKVPLLTELAELDRLGAAGELSFETIYAKR